MSKAGPRKRIIATHLSFRALAALAGISTRTLQRAKRDNKWPARLSPRDSLMTTLTLLEHKWVREQDGGWVKP